MDGSISAPYTVPYEHGTVFVQFVVDIVPFFFMIPVDGLQLLSSAMSTSGNLVSI